MNKIDSGKSCSGWKPSVTRAMERDYGSDLLAERHHSLYGRPWLLGRDYFDYLTEKKLVKSNDRVLDFGCGAGRLGIWLINFLKPGYYYGLDTDKFSIEAFVEYECRLHGLRGKMPNISCGDMAEFDDVSFDVILDMYVTSHFSKADALVQYKRFSERLSRGGLIVSAGESRFDNVDLMALKLEVVEAPEQSSSLLQELQYRKHSNNWLCFKKIR